MYENCGNCIEGRPRIGRLVGVTRTLRLAVFEGEGVPQGTPQDLTGKTVVVRVLQDGTENIFVPEFVVEGTDNNVVKFTWPANRQAVGNYTFDITITDGSGNVSRVNWHGRTGIRLVAYSHEVYGEDAVGVKSNDEIGLIGYFTTSGEGMSAYEEWLASDESEGYERTVDGFFEWMKQPATDAAAAAEAQMTDIQSRADEDHRVAGADHTLADSDHTRAGNDHTRAEGDHMTASDDHRIAAADHSTAGDDHTLAAADHVTAVADHKTAGDDHTLAESDHGTATADHGTAGADHETATADHGTASDDHTQAGLDHTQAVSDHGTASDDHTQAGLDHTQAGNDHTMAEADHAIAADDHTQAVADHAIVEGYDDRLTNVEGEVSQLGQEVSRIDFSIDGYNIGEPISGYLRSSDLERKEIGNVNYHYYIIRVQPSSVVSLSQNTNYIKYAFLKSYGSINQYADGEIAVRSGDISNFTLPSDCNYIYIFALDNGTDRMPKSILVDGTEILLPNGILANIEKVNNEIEDINNTIDGINYIGEEYTGYLRGSDLAPKSTTDNNYKYYIVSVEPSAVVSLLKAENWIKYAFLKSYGTTNAYATGEDAIRTGDIENFTLPNDCHYIYVVKLDNGTNRMPKNIIVSGIDYLATNGVLPLLNELSGKIEHTNEEIDELHGDHIISQNGGDTLLTSIFASISRKKTLTSSPTYGKAQFNLLFFSDIHGSSDGGIYVKPISRILEIKNKFSSYITECLHGGDSVKAYITDDNTLDYTGAEGILNTLGNHDILKSNNTFGTEEEGYNKIMAAHIADWGVTYTVNKCYYYKDYTAQNIRLIVLDSMHYNSTQDTWFAGVLASARTAGLSVIVAMHHCPDTTFVPNTNSNFCTMSSLSLQSVVIDDTNKPTDTLQSEIANGLDFVCWLFGHQHRDYIGNFSNHTNQLGIAIAKASGGYAGWEQDSERVEGTKAYDCIDIVSVDVTAKIIKLFRIGNNTDRLMRQKNFLTLDYSTGTIISES